MWRPPYGDELNEILLDLEVQLKNQLRLKSLKVLCVNNVVEYLPLYAKQGLTRISSLLPKTLSSLVYQVCLQSVKDNSYLPSMKDWLDFEGDYKDKINLFAGYELEEFDTRILGCGRKLDRHQKPFEQLAKESPKLRCFKDNHSYEGYIGNTIFDRIRVYPSLSEYYTLNLMPNLVVLEIQFLPVKDSDLQFIGTFLPLLQRLKFFVAIQFFKTFGTFTFKGLEYLTNLKSLKHLTIHVDYPFNTESSQLATHCLLLMPQVNAVVSGADAPFEHAHHEFPSYEDHPIELGLEHFVIAQNSVIPPNVSLPYVTKVFVVEAPFPVSLQQFKKLHHLSFAKETDQDWSQLEQTLTEVGHQLKTLYFTYYYSCDLMLVLPLCPNLIELHLDAVLFNEENFNESQLKNCVPKLKKFKHELIDGINNENFFESRGLLHFLLTSCPDLEELSVHAIKMKNAEIKLMIEEMEAGALAIQKLQKVEILAVLDRENISCYAEFAYKFCVKNCRILKEVKISEWMNIRDEPNPQLDPALDIQACVNKKQMYRSNSNVWPYPTQDLQKL